MRTHQVILTLILIYFIKAVITGLNMHKMQEVKIAGESHDSHMKVT